MPPSSLSLPPALLDLTLTRVAHSRNTGLSNVVGGPARWQRALGRRGLQQAALLDATPMTDYEMPHSSFTPAALARRQRRSTASAGSYLALRIDKNKLHPVEKLMQKVQTLDEAIKSEEITVHEFQYSEEELLAIYENVLAVPIPETSETNTKKAKEAIHLALKKAEEEEDIRILRQVEERICSEEPNIVDATNFGSLHLRLLARAHEIISRTHAARAQVNPNASGSKPLVPIGVLTVREYEALVRSSMRANDPAAGEFALEIAKISGLRFPDEAFTKILKAYAISGNSTAADKAIAHFVTDKPTEVQRHFHIQAHLNATPKDMFPTSAIEILHQYESRNACAPMQTYTSVIASLYSRPLAMARAYAWNLFSHMRYVAHPDPDGVLYTLMIRACASPISKAQSSEPEKALDLWTEMTVDHKIQPTVGTYNAIILACAKSGEKMYINEAFRLTKQMLDSHRDARGFSAYRPDKKTFCALLEGTKRVGDLSRARWILAEMMRGAQELERDANKVDVEIDDEVMMHLFQTYAAYKPPSVKAATKIVAGSDNAAQPTESTVQKVQGVESEGTEKQAGEDTKITMEADVDAPSFAHIPPQSHTEVIREVKFLFNCILQDRSNNTGSSSSISFSSLIPKNKFGNVELSPRLIGSYLSVFYKHAPLETSQKLFETVFDDLQVTCTPRLMVEALERCMNSRRGEEREIAFQFSDKLWKEWIIMENVARENGKPIQARLIERAHVSRIRLLAITERITQAMDALRKFGARYPPEIIKTPTPKPAFSSTRVSLTGERPLVRLTAPTEVPDDYIPPLIVFRDVEVLHHRLVAEAREKDIAYVKWLSKSYEWALRLRRNKAMKMYETKKKDLLVDDNAQYRGLM